MNTKGMITHIEHLGKGTLSSVLIHPREIFSIAIAQKAAQIVLVHNHPSGDTTPSKQDIVATKTLLEVSKIMQLPIAEHIILSPTEYTLLLQSRKRVKFQ